VEVASLAERGTWGEADALWTGATDVSVGVNTADCVPILLVDPDGHRVAAIHSGWRGTEAEIAGAGVEALVARGAKPARLLAAIGPSIRMCCYEVGDDLAERFVARFGRAVVASDGGKPHLDLPKAVSMTLLGRGLREGNIEVLPHCTSCEAGDFFSFRREAGVTGRHLNFATCQF